MGKIKEKLEEALGGAGIILYFVLSIAISVLPFVMIDTSFFMTCLCVFGIQLFPPISLIFWIWGLVCAIKGPQDFFAILYYVVIIIFVAIPWIIDLISWISGKSKE